MSYKVPVDDINFNLKSMGLLEEVQNLSGFEEITDDLVDAVIEENSRLVEDEIAPLNVVGDQDHPVCTNGEVTLSKGFKEDQFEKVSKMRSSLYADEKDDLKAIDKIVNDFKGTFFPEANTKTPVPNEPGFNGTAGANNNNAVDNLCSFAFVSII